LKYFRGSELQSKRQPDTIEEYQRS
jgi:hypothetical protein